MGDRGNSTAQGAATTGQNLANQYSGAASSIGSNLVPTLTAQASNPQGMNPLDIARTDTASMQSAGGSQGAAVGSGLLKAARTRNAGGADAAIADSSRSAGERLSNDTLQTRLKNASLKSGERDSALKGLGSLYGENVTGGNQALGQVASNVNADTNAENASWDWSKDLFAPVLGDATQIATARLGHR